MKRYTFTVGTGLDKDGKAITPEQKTIYTAEARAYFVRVFGGFSEQSITGGWLDDNGNLVMEQSLRYVVLTDNYTNGLGEQAAHQLRMVFNQSSVLMEKEEVAAQFVSEEATT